MLSRRQRLQSRIQLRRRRRRVRLLPYLWLLPQHSGDLLVLLRVLVHRGVLGDPGRSHDEYAIADFVARDHVEYCFDYGVEFCVRELYI